MPRIPRASTARSSRSGRSCAWPPTMQSPRQNGMRIGGRTPATRRRRRAASRASANREAVTRQSSFQSLRRRTLSGRDIELQGHRAPAGRPTPTTFGAHVPEPRKWDSILGFNESSTDSVLDMSTTRNPFGCRSRGRFSRPGSCHIGDVGVTELQAFVTADLPRTLQAHL